LNVALTRQAHRDLNDILSRIEADNPLAAERMAREFARKFRLLGLHPGLGSRAQGKFRVLPVRRVYRVIYQVFPLMLRIERIVHAARHWPPADLAD